MEANKNIVILGHHNYGLSLLLENLYAILGNEIKVTIIENVHKNDHSFYDVSYAHPNSTIHKEWYLDHKFHPQNIYFNSSISPHSKEKIFRFFKDHCGIGLTQYENSIHPDATVSSTVTYGNGLNVGPQSVIAPHTKMGKFVFINRSLSIGHHCNIGDFVTISPGTHIASNVTIGKNTLINIGCTVFDGLEIGENSIIGAGSLVTKSIPSNVLAYGRPCKIIKEI